MIKVTRINDSEIIINSDLIEFVESSPDTIISLIDGKKIIVKETPDEIVQKVAQFRCLTFEVGKTQDVKN